MTRITENSIIAKQIRELFPDINLSNAHLYCVDMSLSERTLLGEREKDSGHFQHNAEMFDLTNLLALSSEMLKYFLKNMKLVIRTHGPRSNHHVFKCQNGLIKIELRGNEGMVYHIYKELNLRTVGYVGDVTALDFKEREALMMPIFEIELERFIPGPELPDVNENEAPVADTDKEIDSDKGTVLGDSSLDIMETLLESHLSWLKSMRGHMSPDRLIQRLSGNLHESAELATVLSRVNYNDVRNNRSAGLENEEFKRISQARLVIRDVRSSPEEIQEAQEFLMATTGDDGTGRYIDRSSFRDRNYHRGIDSGRERGSYTNPRRH